MKAHNNQIRTNVGTLKKSNLAAETCDIQYGKLPLIALSCFVYPSKVSFLLGLACYYA
jgi:hypothetical protein